MWHKRNGNKFNAKPTVINGIKFQSTWEGRFYSTYLLPRSMAGDFTIDRQKKFSLVVNDKKVCEYWADFLCTSPTGDMVVYETKGRFAPGAKDKLRLFEALYNIPVYIAYSLSKIERLKGYKKRK